VGGAVKGFWRDFHWRVGIVAWGGFKSSRRAHSASRSIKQASTVQFKEVWMVFFVGWAGGIF